MKTKTPSKGDKIKQLRAVCGIRSQAALAKAAGISEAAVSLIERDEEAPRAFSDLVDRLGINPEWIEGKSNGMWVVGKHDENIARVKAMAVSAPQQQSSANHWKDEAFDAVKSERDRLREQLDQMRSWYDKLLGKVNFLEALGKTSYSKLRKVGE